MADPITTCPGCGVPLDAVDLPRTSPAELVEAPTGRAILARWPDGVEDDPVPHWLVTCWGCGHSSEGTGQAVEVPFA